MKNPPLSPFSMSVWLDINSKRWKWSVHNKRMIVDQGTENAPEKASTAAAKVLVKRINTRNASEKVRVQG